jgi:hypothetical protein
MRTWQFCLALPVLAFTATASIADVCDYRPSAVAGDFLTGLATGVASVASTAGVALKGAGFYTLAHATTNATMLASTAGGVSAAGTVGIMGGTGGLIGGTASVLMAPAMIVAAGATAAGTVVYEGGCYFFGPKEGLVDDFDEVLSHLTALSSITDIDQFSIYSPPDDPTRIGIFIKNSDGSAYHYLVDELYIQDGVVMHRRFFGDRAIIDVMNGFAVLP